MGYLMHFFFILFTCLSKEWMIEACTLSFL